MRVVASCSTNLNSVDWRRVAGEPPLKHDKEAEAQEHFRLVTAGFAEEASSDDPTLDDFISFLLVLSCLEGWLFTEDFW